MHAPLTARVLCAILGTRGLCPTYRAHMALPHISHMGHIRRVCYSGRVWALPHACAACYLYRFATCSASPRRSMGSLSSQSCGATAIGTLPARAHVRMCKCTCACAQIPKLPLPFPSHTPSHAPGRYWGFLSKCRMPMIPNMALPFGCPMDSLYLTERWAQKKVKFREHTFLSNPHVPDEMRENTLTLTVAARGVAPAPRTASSLELPYGTPLASVKELVMAAFPRVRVIEIANVHLRRLCRWLGSTQQQQDFNRLILCVAHAYDLRRTCI